ncbi:Complement C5 [Nibea albiflora]|nr:Complement C5 [Nibea albiflora]
MKVCVLLMCVCCLCWRVDTSPDESRSYLITAPVSLRLDAAETVLLQLFGFTDEVTVYVFLKTSMAPDHVVLAQDIVTLNTQNLHQAAAKVRLYPGQLDKSVNHVILHVKSTDINKHLSIPVSRTNGFLFIQTDKPLYTPHQRVKVRAFSLNQELRPANRSVFLTFKDPDHTTVDIVEMIDVNNGIPSMQNPFKIPIRPNFSILMEPEVNYISYGQFSRFNFKLSARYLHGAPVADGAVLLHGDVDVSVNVEKLLSKHDGPKDLNSLEGKYLYVTVLVEEATGGLSQEAEFASVLVKDHLGKPVSRVRVRLVKRQLFMNGRDNEEIPCPDSANSQSDGLAVFICNTPRGGVKVVLEFETADSALPAASQASLSLKAEAYHSPNQRYLYIDPPLPGQGLEVGRFASIKVYSATPFYIPVNALSYVVISKGKVVYFGSRKFLASTDNRQTLSFQVTPDMVPSIRLLVYYILFGEGTSELVADSVWLEVKDKCVNGLKTDLSYRSREYKPKENIQLDIQTNQDGLLALSAVDTALYTLRPNYRDPVAMALRTIEGSDLGCGGGGGRDSADVFRLAGLTFMTNANAQASTSSEACTAVVRPKRSVSAEEKAKKAESYGPLRKCCEHGMRYSPKSVTCLQFSEQLFRKPQHHQCRRVFTECCEFIQREMESSYILGRHDLGPDFDQTPLVRSYFPESWMWEVQPVRSGRVSLTRTLPDSLTTWEIKAVSMFQNGICVAEPVQVSVSLPLSVNIPLPYQVVRGEQLELQGSVYNQQPDSITYCLTLKAGPALCLLKSQPVAGQEGQHSTACSWSSLSAGGVGKVTFTVMGLEPGEHTLTFTLKTRNRKQDILQKKLRVVPEGVKTAKFSGGRLDPQGLYGSEKRTVTLKNHVPANIVPNTPVERMLTINGVSVPGDDGPLGRPGRRHPEELSRHETEDQRRLTALVVKTLSLVDSVVSVDHQSLSDSVSWLIRNAQQPDGSFKDKSSFRPNRVMHAPGVKSVYVRAVATFALTLHDSNSMEASSLLDSLEKLARQEGNPPALRYWQESSVTAGWLKPDQSSGLTVETTAYVLLTVLLKDTTLTLEAVTEYSKIIPRAALNQDLIVRLSRKSDPVRVQLTQSRPVATPLQVTTNDDITVSTGYGSGVSSVKVGVAKRLCAGRFPRMPFDFPLLCLQMKTVYYETAASSQTCHFDLTIEVKSASSNPSMGTHVVACAKYKPPPNEVMTESSLTVMEIQLPTDVDPVLEDLRQFRDIDEPLISHYERQGNTVIIQMDTVPSEVFLCIGFRVMIRFAVSGKSDSLMSVYEPQDKGSLCTKHFSHKEQKLQQLCVGQQCQCMTAACATYRGNIAGSLTAAKRTDETCQAHIKYAYRVTVKSSAAEGNFMTYTATIAEVLKNTDTVFESMSSGTEIYLVKKATCSDVDIQNNKQYLVMGASGSEVKVDGVFRYRLPLDSDALVDLWPTECSSPECSDYTDQLADFALDLQLFGCPDAL